MNYSNGMRPSVLLLLSVLTLYGCEDLIIRDTSSLLIPRFHRSEILGFVAGFGTTFAGRTRLTRNAQAAVKRGDEPEDGGYHRRLSNRLGLLRFVDCFAAGDRLERDRGSDQFRQRRRVPIFRPQRKAVSTGVIAPTGRAMEVILRSRKTSRTWQGRRILILN